VKVVLVTDGYLPRLGGIELHVRDLGLQLAAAGHDVVVVTSTGAGRESMTTPPSGGRLVVQRLGRPWARQGTGLRGRTSALSGLFDGADVVHAHTSVVSPLAWRAAATARRRGTAALVTVHSMLPGGSVLPMTTALRRATARGLRWSAVSEAVAVQLREHVDAPVAVLHNGIDPAPWRARGQRPPNPCAGDHGAASVFTVVSALRFASRKRPHVLLDVLSHLRTQLPAATSVRAVLVGDGPLLRDVRLRARADGMLPWLELPGRLEREELAGVYAQGDVYVAPARWESFGLAALEARCAGLPVLAMAGSGVEEFVHEGVEGFLAHDDAHLGELLVRMACDAKARETVGRHNSTVLPHVSWSRVVAETLHQYHAAGAAAEREPSPSAFPGACAL